MGKERTKATGNGAEGTEAPKKKKAAAMNPFGDLDQVKQILFGAENEEINERLDNLDAHFTKVIATLKDTVNKRFNDVEATLKKQNEALNNRLNDEEAARSGAATTLGEEIQQVATHLQENRKQLDTIIANTDKALRKALNEEADKALKDRTARFDDLSAKLEEAVATLGDAKTDRHGLADLLDHLSAGLRNSQ